jgi:hypothetical protein
MTEPTEDMIRAGMEAYATENVRGTSVDGKVRRIIASALASAPPAPVVGEPVAWRYRYVGPTRSEPGPWRVREEPAVDEELQPAFYEFVPLYAHPPAASPERMAAHIAKLEAALEEIIKGSPEKEPRAYDDYGDMIADTAERHGDLIVDVEHWRLAQIARAALAQEPS